MKGKHEEGLSGFDDDDDVAISTSNNKFQPIDYQRVELYHSAMTTSAFYLCFNDDEGWLPWRTLSSE